MNNNIEFTSPEEAYGFIRDNIDPNFNPKLVEARHNIERDYSQSFPIDLNAWWLTPFTEYIQTNFNNPMGWVEIPFYHDWCVITICIADDMFSDNVMEIGVYSNEDWWEAHPNTTPGIPYDEFTQMHRN